MATTIPSYVMTYNSLTALVLSYLERSDVVVTNFMPAAITLAEFEIAQNIKTLGQMSVMDSVMTAGNPVILKPARWRKTTSMTIVTATGKQPMLLRKLEYMNNYAPLVGSLGQPLYYGDYDYDRWLVSPTPDQAYAFETLCYTRLEPLSTAVQTNWLTINAPNAMLFGTLKQTAPFLKNDARLPIWEALFDKAIAALKTEDTLRIGDRSAVAVDS